MTITYLSSRAWGYHAKPVHHREWLAHAASFLRGLFPGAEVTVEEHEDRSTVRFGGELPEPLDYSEQEALALLHSEWQWLVGTQD